MWKIYSTGSVLVLLLIFGFWGLRGCGSQSVAGDGLVPLELELEVVDLLPGTVREVKVVSGKLESAMAPQNSGITAQVAEEALVIAVAKNVKAGKYVVFARDNNGKEATLHIIIHPPRTQKRAAW
jgi:hypothetical protein